MTRVCFPVQNLEKRTTIPNDPFERVSTAAQAIINNAAAFYEGQVDGAETPAPSEGERLALKRAMARFIIDSGIASAQRWL